jgi:hypothetical protein
MITETIAMASAAPALDQHAIDEATRHLPRFVTMLELVEAVATCSKDDREVVATVISMLTRGRVILRGNFRGEPIENLIC